MLLCAHLSTGCPPLNSNPSCYWCDISLSPTASSAQVTGLFSPYLLGCVVNSTIYYYILVDILRWCTVKSACRHCWCDVLKECLFFWRIFCDFLSNLLVVHCTWRPKIWLLHAHNLRHFPYLELISGSPNVAYFKRALFSWAVSSFTVFSSTPHAVEHQVTFLPSRLIYGSLWRIFHHSRVDMQHVYQFTACFQFESALVESFCCSLP